MSRSPEDWKNQLGHYREVESRPQVKGRASRVQAIRAAIEQGTATPDEINELAYLLGEDRDVEGFF